MRAVMSSKVGPVRHRIIAPAVHFLVCHTLCPTRGFATTNQQSQFCHSGTPLPHLLDAHTTDSGVTRYAVCVQPRLPRVRGVAGCGVLSVAAHSRERGVPGALHFTANPRALHNHSPRDTTPRRPDSSPSVCVCVLPPPSQSVRESGPRLLSPAAQSQWPRSPFASSTARPCCPNGSPPTPTTPSRCPISSCRCTATACGRAPHHTAPSWRTTSRMTARCQPSRRARLRPATPPASTSRCCRRRRTTRGSTRRSSW